MEWNFLSYDNLKITSVRPILSFDLYNKGGWLMGFAKTTSSARVYSILIPLVSCLLASTSVFASDGSDPRWSFSVGEYPVIEGDVVVRTGIASSMRYTAASETSTVQLSMAGESMRSLMIRNKETNVICVKSAETLVAKDNGRLNLSGTVSCITNPANPSERESIPVSGWFGLEE